MAIYVDNVRVPHMGKLWCHLVADTLDELHHFAKRLEVPRRGFHYDASYPHYDITIELREMALQLGAIAGNRRDIIRCAKQLKEQFQDSFY